MKRMEPKGIFLVLGAGAMWGTAGLFVNGLSKYGIREMQTVFARALFSALILGLMILLTDRSRFRIRLKDLWLFVSTGLFSIVLFNYCYYTTMRLSSLSVAAVLLYTAPFFVVLMSIPLFRERLTVQKGIALLCAFFGCCLVSGLFGSKTHISGECLVYGLLTGFGYSLYTIFGNLLLERGYHSLTITFYTFVFTFAGTLPFLKFAEMGAVFQEPKAAAVAFAMAVFNTVLPYLLYTAGLQRMPASVAPIIATIEPVVATLIGGFSYGQWPDIAGTVGILLVLGAVVILKVGKKECN